MLMAIAEYPSSAMPEPLPPILMFFISNVHHLIPIKLDLHNYTIWKIQFEGALKASSLFQHVQESESPSPTITDSAGNSIPNPLYPKWVLADSFIRSCLISTLTPDILFQAKDFHTVPDLWKFLEQKFTSKSTATRLDYQMAEIISKRRSKTIFGAEIARKRRKCSPNLTSSGLPLTASKISSGVHLSGVTTYQDTFQTANSFNTSTKATWSPSNQCNATSHLPPDLISNKGFGASPNKECRCTAGGFSVSSTDTVFGNGPVIPDVQREIEKERMRSEISCEEHENRQLVDKEVTAEVMSEKENGFHRAEGFQGFAGFSSSTTGPTILNEPTPSQSTWAPSPPISVEPSRSATSFNATTNTSWSPNQWNSASHSPFNLNSNKEFGASPNEECRIGFHRAEGFQEFAGPSPSTTGQAILNKPKLEVVDQANSRFLNDRAALSFEERMGYQAPQGNGNFQRLPYHGFWGSCGPHVSQNWNASISSEPGAAIAEPAILNEPNMMVGDQANSRFLKGTVALPLEEKKGYQMPFQGFQGSSGPQISQGKLDANTNLSGSKRKTLSPPPSGASYLSSFVSRKNKKHWNCALCQTSFPDLQLENHLRSKRHVEASNLSPGNSQNKELESGVVDGKLQKAKDDQSYKFWGDMCQIETDIKKVMDEHKERLQEPNENALSVSNIGLKEAPSAIISLRLKLITLQKSPNQSVGDFLQELRKIADQLADAGSPVSKFDFVHLSLRGIPPEFDSVKPAVLRLSLNYNIEDIHNLIVSQCSGIQSKSGSFTGFVSQMAKGTSGDSGKSCSGNDEHSGHWSRLTPSQSTGDLPMPIAVETFQSAKSLDTTTNTYWSTLNPWNATSHLPFDLNSNKLFGESPDKESRRPSSIANGSSVSSAITGLSVGPVIHGVQCEIQKEIIGKDISSEETGCEHGHLADKEVRSGKEMGFQGFACFSASTTEPTTILNHANSRFLKDTVATSLEEEKKGKASGSLQRLAFQGFQGSSGPQISQCKSATIRFGSSKTETLSPQTEARLRAELSTGKTAVEVVAGIADPKIPSSLKEELDGQVQHVKEQLNGVDDLCRIGTDTEKVDG